MMDIITFTLSTPKQIIHFDIKSFDIQCFLNYKSLGVNIFNAAEVLSANKYNNVGFDLFTCSCGVAGCAGYFNQIKQHKTTENVQWRFPDDDDMYAVDKQTYTFDRKQFDTEFKNLLECFITLEKRKIYHESVLTDLSYKPTIESIQDLMKFYDKQNKRRNN